MIILDVAGGITCVLPAFLTGIVSRVLDRDLKVDV
jgi:hypothetical protein